MERNERLLIIPILILLSYFIFRLVDQFKMLTYFPFDFTNDWSSYIAQLHFLKVCGFHNLCPFWFNGFISFQLIPPAWFFFTLPYYYLFNNVLYATYFSLITIFLIGFIAVFLSGKWFNFTKLQQILFFSLLFMNANVVGTYIRQGRITELFGLTIFFIFAFFVLWYKDNTFDKKFLLVPFLLVAILSLVLMFCLFLVSDFRQKVLVLFSIMAALLLSAFWWIPFIANFPISLGAHLTNNFTSFLLSFSKSAVFINLGITLVSLFFMSLFFICAKTKKFSRDFIFYTPMLILASLVLTRLVVFIPLLKTIYPDVYFSFFLFFGLILFFKSDLLQNNKKVLFLLIIASLGSVAVSHYHSPYFIEHTASQKEILGILPEVDGKFIFLSLQNEKIYSKAFYSYAPIYYNLSTPAGWHASINYVLYQKINFLSKYFENNQCKELKNSLYDLQVDQIISIGAGCARLQNCGFEELKYNSEACLYGTN